MQRKDIPLADIARVQENAIDDYFWKYFFNSSVGYAGLCSLCANSGIIDTRTSAISGSGVNAGRLNYCICPNGRAMREEEYPLEASLKHHRNVADAIVTAIERDNAKS